MKATRAALKLELVSAHQLWRETSQMEGRKNLKGPLTRAGKFTQLALVKKKKAGRGGARGGRERLWKKGRISVPTLANRPEPFHTNQSIQKKTRISSTKGGRRITRGKGL